MHYASAHISGGGSSRKAIKGAVRLVFGRAHVNRSYYLTDITEIDVLGNHTCLCDSRRIC